MITPLWRNLGATVLVLAVPLSFFSQCLLSTYEPSLPLAPDSLLEALWVTLWHLLPWENGLSLLLLSFSLPALALCSPGSLRWLEKGALVGLFLALVLLAFRNLLDFLSPLPSFLFDLSQQGDPPGNALDLSRLRPLAALAWIGGPLCFGLTRILSKQFSYLRLIGWGFVLAGLLALFSFLWNQTFMTFTFYRLCACDPHVDLAGILPSIGPLVLILLLGLSGFSVLSAKGGEGFRGIKQREQVSPPE